VRPDYSAPAHRSNRRGPILVAKALGLDLPTAILLRPDEMIE
jgi:hypothetical protein